MSMCEMRAGLRDGLRDRLRGGLREQPKVSCFC